jgi:ceramide glucosyltransferase
MPWSLSMKPDTSLGASMAMAYAAAWFCLLSIFLNLISSQIARSGRGRGGRRFRRHARRRAFLSSGRSAVSIISAKKPWNRVSSSITRPMKLFFASRGRMIPSCRLSSLIAKHPNLSARLIVGDEKVSANPKLNNCVRGWDASRYDWIILADANVLMPRD